MTIRLLSVNVATVGSLLVNDTEEGFRRIPSAYDKRAVAGAVQITRTGLTGDEQANRDVHGGIDKAVYAYPVEHYPYWQEQRRMHLQRDDVMPHGAFAENLTIAGLLEDQVWIGDRLQIGEALLEVTEPREPCFKFTIRMGFGKAAKLMLHSGYTGFYLKVLQEGRVAANDAITLIPGPREETVATFNARRRMGRQPDLF
ncbi:MOSC domain-containing protein [Oxalicibacterium faecigallinarum]|uniref:Molybdenum cofactor biosysynthesis protein n=1 Tax=Oxalicibacterium faecigallinarum TaxID=573741 RepID=A0A8J3AYT1_9BURK|nr:MOSC domain-containing protein [Oxalicibacterium faecigallinarum]GGI19198.1 molybdenum cofactor biosysynthesis protein [Oxalicibacterium faecigallinarum]